VDHERCPYCLAGLGDDEPVVRCASCAARHHRACFLEHGTCTVYGCGSRDLKDGPGEADEGRRGWRLHPFLPVGPFPAQRPAQFLFVKSVPLTRSRPLVAPALRLTVPPQSSCGRELEGHVDLHLPELTQVMGVRLRIRALLDERGSDRELFHEEAVLIGQPRRRWLERLRLWDAQERPPMPLAGAVRIAFAFDPGRLHHAQALPQDPSFGPWHVLEVGASLEAGELSRETRRARILVAHDHARCQLAR
jgi:hypothetical protein